MHRALAVIADRYRFNFDILGDSGAMSLYENNGRRLMVQSFVLEGKTA